jgi:RNA polymerase sigma-70 factor (ECF subfamily)
MTIGPIPPSAGEEALLDRARSGDDDAFRELVEPHRTRLHAHCYQILASVPDAEDALQDALLRAWASLGQYQGRGSVKAWLYTIATRTALDLAARRPPRTLPANVAPGEQVQTASDRPDSESVWLEPYPDEQLALVGGLASPEARYELRESVELAFVVALQLLPPRQRAVLLLREVLAFSARETATMLQTTEAAVNSALQRARAVIAARRPQPSQQATLRALGDDRSRDLVARYMDGLERADLTTMLTLVVEDASWSMPPAATWYQGRESISQFLIDGPFTVRWRHLPAHANGQLAVGCYIWDGGRQRYLAAVLDVLTIRGTQIAAVTAFLKPEIFPRFGLPLELN